MDQSSSAGEFPEDANAVKARAGLDALFGCAFDARETCHHAFGIEQLQQQLALQPGDALDVGAQARRLGAFVLLDAKRVDIGSTVPPMPRPNLPPR